MSMQNGRTAASAVLLTAKNVTCTYGGLVAVDNASLALGQGEVVGLIGPNGAGKTTFLNALSGLQGIKSGTVHMSDVDVTRARSSRRAELGMARSFQLIRLVKDLSIVENVMLGGHLRGREPLVRRMARREKSQLEVDAMEALEQVGIAHIAKRFPDEISFGLQRRAEFARVIVAGGSVVLLDEPMAGLGAPDLDDVIQFVGRLKSQGRAVLLVEHSLAFVRATAGRLVILDRGRVIVEGPTDEALEDSRTKVAYMGAADA